MPRRRLLEKEENMITDDKVIESMVLYEKDPEKKIAWITFNRPDKNNCLPCFAFYERIPDLIRDAEMDDDVKVIIFRGNGPCFGSGADASELGYYIGYGSGKTKEESRRPSQRRRIYPDRDGIWGPKGMEPTIMNCLKVTISQVHGYCYGGHFQIAMASDMVICSDDAYFTHPVFRYLGVEGNVGLYVDLMGLRRVKELMLTGRPFDALEAERYGMVNKVVTKDKLEETVLEYAQACALQTVDSIVIGKSLFEAHQGVRGYFTSGILGYMGHGWITNLRTEPGEWNFVKDRRDKGTKGSFTTRDEMLPPRFRLGEARRGAKK